MPVYDFYHVRVCCIDSVWGGPFNSYDFFAAWGRGEGETLSIHVVPTQCAGGLRNVKFFCKPIPQDIIWYKLTKCYEIYIDLQWNQLESVDIDVSWRLIPFCTHVLTFIGLTKSFKVSLVVFHQTLWCFIYSYFTTPLEVRIFLRVVFFVCKFV